MKKLFILGGIFFFAGLIVLTIGMAVLDWNVFNLEGREYTEVVEEYDAEEITKLDLNIMDSKVSIVRGLSGSKIQVKYYESEWDIFTVASNDGVLNIIKTAKEREKWIRMFDFSWLRPTVITVPMDICPDVIFNGGNSSITVEQGSYGYLNLRTTNNSIDLANLSASEIKAETTNASVSIDECGAPVIWVKTRNGSVGFEDLSADTVTAITTNSSIKTENITAAELLLNSTNGSIKVEDFTGDKLEAVTTNSSINVSKVKAEEVRLTSTNGSIKFELEADILRLKTTNSSIKGEISRRNLEEFEIYTYTTNSNNNLPSRPGNGSGKSLRAETTNGSISIKFNPNRN